MNLFSAMKLVGCNAANTEMIFGVYSIVVLVVSTLHCVPLHVCQVRT